MPTPLLIITYYWPPGSSPGVQRWLKFVKYLPDLGWQPIILTVKNGSFPAYDESLMDEVPDSVITYRARSLEPFALYNLLRGKKGKQVEVGMGNIKSNKSLLSRIANYIRANYFIPDARKGWNILAARKMMQIVREHKVKMVVTTGPPHSTHLLGLKLKKKLAHISWLADLRDPWTSVYYNKILKRTTRSEQKDFRLESKVLKTADAVSVISEGMKAEFKDRANEIHVLYNGYDPEDLAGPQDENPGQFEISYIGNFKVSQDIPSFWMAISKLINEHPKGHLIRLRIVGNVSQTIIASLEDFKLEENVSIQGFVPHKEATKLMKGADLLYLPIPDTGNNKSIITGKIFEYLASRTPILGVGPKDGDAAALLKECERPPMLDYSEEEKMYKRIEEELNGWIANDGKKQEVQSDVHLKLTREAITHKLSNILSELVDHEED